MGVIHYFVLRYIEKNIVNRSSRLLRLLVLLQLHDFVYAILITTCQVLPMPLLCFLHEPRIFDHDVGTSTTLHAMSFCHN